MDSWVAPPIWGVTIKLSWVAAYSSNLLSTRLSLVRSPQITSSAAPARCLLSKAPIKAFSSIIRPRDVLTSTAPPGSIASSAAPISPTVSSCRGICRLKMSLPANRSFRLAWRRTPSTQSRKKGSKAATAMPNAWP